MSNVKKILSGIDNGTIGVSIGRRGAAPSWYEIVVNRFRPEIADLRIVEDRGTKDRTLEALTGADLRLMAEALVAMADRMDGTEHRSAK